MGLDNPPAVSDYPQKLGLPGVRYVMPGWFSRAVVNSPPLINGDMHYQPIFVGEDTTYTRIGIEVITFRAGGLVRLGIYAWNNGMPGALVLDAGTVGTDAAAFVEIVIAQLLTRGYYFLARRTENAAAANADLRALDAVNGAVVPPVAGFRDVQSLAMMFPVLHAVVAWTDPATAPTAGLGADYAAIYLREG